MTTFAEDIAAEAQSTRKRATLKRASGGTLDEAHDMAWLFYLLTKHRRGDTPGEKRADEYRLFLVASLMAFDRAMLDAYAKNNTLPSTPKNFAATLDAVEKAGDPAAWETRHKPTPDPNRRITPLERRLRLLLDARMDAEGGGELPFRLRQAVKFALSQEARIDWDALLWDLRRWDEPNKERQKQWARTFYGYHGPRDGAGAEDGNADTDADTEDDIDLDEE